MDNLKMLHVDKEEIEHSRHHQQLEERTKKIFLHKTLKRITGQPYYGSLWVITGELKANASSVLIHLSGRMYDFLGLLLTTQQYATLSQVEFKPLPTQVQSLPL